jgi:pyruvate kinase
LYLIEIFHPSISKDKKDVLFALNNNLDWIALSFVRQPEDLTYLRNYISNFNKEVKIISKIEKSFLSNLAITSLDIYVRVGKGNIIRR